MKSIQLTIQDIPVHGRPAVCVIGGGPAGVSAAVGAARAATTDQHNVWLIEKNGFCGGATVAGLSGTICGLHSSGDKPEQIVFGFASEFHDLLKNSGGVTQPIPFGKTCLVPHDSFIWKTVADALLEKHQVTVRYHTRFIKAVCDDHNMISTLIFHGPEGFFALKPETVVDASGDATVVHDAGVTSYMGKEGVVQTPTMIFRLGNIDMPAFLKLDPRELVRKVTEADKSGQYSLPRHHVYIFPMPSGSEVLCNMTKITWPEGGVPNGLSSIDLTFAEIEGRRQVREYTRFLRNEILAFKNAYIVETGSQVGIRQTRSIHGKSTLKNTDVINARKTSHPVALSAWPIEAHGAGDLSIIYLEDDYYEIPFETLIPLKATNYLVAGRCMSAEHEALASARVTAQCFSMGYAVGAAARLMHAEKIDAQQVSGLMVTDWMKQQRLKTAYQP